MRVLLSSFLVDVALSVGACAGTSPRPLTSASVIGAVPARQTAVVLRGMFDYHASAASARFQLPPGRYRPVAEDAHGVFYQAPVPLRVGVNDGAGQPMIGGIHLANAAGQSYSFASLWVAFHPGDFTKLPLPDEFQAGYGRAWVWTRHGQTLSAPPYH